MLGQPPAEKHHLILAVEREAYFLIVLKRDQIGPNSSRVLKMYASKEGNNIHHREASCLATSRLPLGFHPRSLDVMVGAVVLQPHDARHDARHCAILVDARTTKLQTCRIGTMGVSDR